MRPSLFFSFLLCLCLNAFAQEPARRAAPPPWSAGLFTYLDSQPYRGASVQVRVLPFLSYRSERLEWYGPFAQARLMRKNGWSVSGRVRWDFGAYEEDDAEILQGLGDRKGTLLLGLGVQKPLNPAWKLSLSIDQDTLGRHDGNESELALFRRLGSPRNRFSGGINLGLRYQDPSWMEDRVGVPLEDARADRPAYRPGHSLHPFVGGQVMARLSGHWTAVGMVTADYLDAAWTDSPLLDEHWTLRSVLTVARSF